MNTTKLEYKWFNKSAKKLATKLYLPSNSNPEKKIINGIKYENNKYVKNVDLKFKNNIDHKMKNLDNFYSKYNKKLEKIIASKSEKKINALTHLEKKFKKDFDKHDKIIKSYKYEIEFTDSQKNILGLWFDECNKIYNKCVELYNTSTFNLNYMKSKLDVFNKIYGNNKKLAPYAILTDEVRIFCSNIKSCLTNLKNSNIKHFTIKQKNTNNLQSIFISKDIISKNGIYTTLLGNIKDFDKKINIDNINSDCRLTFDKKFKKYYLIIPEYYDMKEIYDRKPIISLDPGEKNFMSYYSLTEYGKIGIDMRKPILRLRNKISKYQRALKKNINKNQTKLKNRLNLKKKIQKKYNKIKNIVKELHNQTALHLCKNYDKILLPEFGTSKMVYNKDERTKKIKENIDKFKKESQTNEEIKEKINKYRKQRKMNRKTAFVLNQLSHYRFKQHILNKSQEYGCQVIIVSEEYTSQACGFCGELSNKYNNRIKECEKCNHKIDRDINGARNILIKNHKEFLK